MLRRICLLVAICVPRLSLAQASAPVSVAGCYAVQPSARDSMRPPFGLSPVIALGSGRDTAYATDGYGVRPGPRGRRRSLFAAAWWPVGRDSIRVWWNNGFEHWTLRLATASDTLRGTVDYQNDGSGFAHQLQPVTAIRRSCPTGVIPPAS